MTALNAVLLEAVKRLAAAPEEQAAYLRQLGTYPSLDELALEFDDALATARGALDGSTTPANELRRLDAKLTAMSGRHNAHLWVVDALTGNEWAEVRVMARRVISAR